MIPMLSSFPTVVSLRLCRPNMLSKLTMPHFLSISSSSSSSSPSSSFSSSLQHEVSQPSCTRPPRTGHNPFIDILTFFPHCYVINFSFPISMILCFVYLFPSNIHHGSYLEPNILAFETKLCFVFVVALKSRTSTSKK